jgi:hypothetical protein
VKNAFERFKLRIARRLVMSCVRPTHSHGFNGEMDSAARAIRFGLLLITPRPPLDHVSF